MFVQSAATAVKSAVVNRQVVCHHLAVYQAVSVECLHSVPHGSQILTVERLVLSAESVLVEEEDVWSCGGEFVEGEEVGGPIVCNLVAGDIDVAAWSRVWNSRWWAIFGLAIDDGVHRLEGNGWKNAELELPE